MKRFTLKHVLFALSMLGIILSACVPPITSAQQTQVAATGVAAANGFLTSTSGPGVEASATPAATVTPRASSATSSVPVAGGTTAAPTSNANNGNTNGNGTPSANVPVTGATAVPTGGSGTAAVCNLGIGPTVSGPRAKVLLKNNTFNIVTVTLGLSAANSLSECGTLSWTLTPQENLRVTLPQTQAGDSCYFAFAVINPGNGQSIVNDMVGNNTTNGFCLTGDKEWIVSIKTDKIRLIIP